MDPGGMEMGHSHGHHGHGYEQMQPAHVKRPASEMHAPPSLTSNVFIGWTSGMALWVAARSLAPTTFEASPWVAVLALASGAACGLICVGSSHSACTPMGRIPAALTTAAGGTLIVTVFINLMGLGLGGETAMGACFFAFAACLLAALLFSCSVHQAYWHRLLFESAVGANMEQKLANAFWHQKVAEFLLHVGVLQKRPGAGHVHGPGCGHDHGPAAVHSHSHGHGH
mmetsp:Transcript_26812/g.59956  ORF Transcript_26812/g.59956 Transcript_26812/m.59956 type:complete len:227 (+) Transcript_26812:91-771(+)|eukprot:CAMPEP_0172592438 /NCGR_PEP_ID=MMETSP1068-20121228/11408_1 /TAXON_ID=35684 /ORGANISM="Pseudopedinella elastica, Strain CCMP716" /LENGTH=226 /DNA_ID=CAMNT_0013389425 /DNA_START=91 /DNA_END=771 /DNA_ORIENTATION=-